MYEVSTTDLAFIYADIANVTYDEAFFAISNYQENYNDYEEV